MLSPVYVKDPYAVCEGRDEKYFALFHEVGHALNKLEPSLSSEIAADVFSSLYCLKKEILSGDDLLAITCVRMLNSSPKHQTAPALTSLMIDVEGRDLGSLSNQEIVAIARQYAKKFGDQTPAKITPKTQKRPGV